MDKTFPTFHSSFKKKYKKLRKGERRRCDERLLLFQSDRTHPLLELHPLHGKYTGFWSINIGGDLRAVFEYLSERIVRFVDVDTHHSLFGS